MSATHTDYETVIYSVKNNVATLKLNRPKQKNAIDFVLRQELQHIVSSIRIDRDIKVLIIEGAGGAFCAGGDISTMTAGADAEKARDRMLNLHLLINDLLMLDRPIIAAVDGPAYGAGVGLALVADIVLASTRARFCLSFLRLGAVPDCGIFYTLPRVVGLQRAKELIFSTREFGAEEAKAMGIVSEIHSANSLPERTQQLAFNMSKLPLSALSITKRGLNASLNSDLPTMLEIEASGQGIARSTRFHQEAAERFLNKQEPLYQWVAAQD